MLGAIWLPELPDLTGCSSSMCSHRDAFQSERKRERERPGYWFMAIYFPLSLSLSFPLSSALSISPPESISVYVFIWNRWNDASDYWSLIGSMLNASVIWNSILFRYFSPGWEKCHRKQLSELVISCWYIDYEIDQAQFSFYLFSL